MRRALLCAALLAGLATAAAAQVAQPAGERARQERLPQSGDPLWRTLATTAITGDPAKGVYVAHHSDAVRALDGRELLISGFMLQTDPLPPFTHFILSRRTPVCAFCPPGAPNEAVEVYAAKPAALAEGEIAVRGRLRLQKDGSQSLIFVLADAEVIGGTHEAALLGRR